LRTDGKIRNLRTGHREPREKIDEGLYSSTTTRTRSTVAMAVVSSLMQHRDKEIIFKVFYLTKPRDIFVRKLFGKS